MNACSVSDILIDPNDHMRVFVTLAGFGYDFRYGCCEETVWMTESNGMIWTPLMGSGSNGLPATAAFSITMHPENADWLYVGTDRGVYASEDAGQTWGLTPVRAADEGPYSSIVTELSWHDPDYYFGPIHCWPATDALW